MSRVLVVPETMVCVVLRCHIRPGRGTVGPHPRGLTLSTDGSTLYVLNNVDQMKPNHTVSAWNSQTGAELASIDRDGNAQSIGVAPDGSAVYVVLERGKKPGHVLVLSPKTHKITNTLQVGVAPGFIEFAPDGSVAYVNNGADGTVSVIDTVTQSIVDTITIGGMPAGVVLAPDGNSGWVTSLDIDLDSPPKGDADISGYVSVFDTKTRDVIAKVEVPGTPSAPTFHPGAAIAYVTSWGPSRTESRGQERCRCSTQPRLRWMRLSMSARHRRSWSFRLTALRSI